LELNFTNVFNGEGIAKNNQNNEFVQSIYEFELKYCEKTDREYGFLFTPKGTLLKSWESDIWTFDNSPGIIVSESDFALFSGNVFTHNHPMGTTFSMSDLKNLATSELQTARVVCPGRRYFSLSYREYGNRSALYETIRAELTDNYINELVISRIKLGHCADDDLLIFNTLKSEIDKWLIKNVAGLGYIYKKGEL
jgi:hypothetical protein